jgi:hypothetical protein
MPTFRPEFLADGLEKAEGFGGRSGDGEGVFPFQPEEVGCFCRRSGEGGSAHDKTR